MKKITMNLTDRDIDNTNFIREIFQTRSNAEAVSIALSTSKFLFKKAKNGDQLLLKKPNGDFEKIIIPGLI